MSKGNSKINVYATQVFIVVLSGRCNPSPKLIGGCMIFLNHVSKWINKKINTNKQKTKKEKKNIFIFLMIQLSQQMREWDLNHGSTCKRAHAMPLSYKALGEKK